MDSPRTVEICEQNSEYVKDLSCYGQWYVKKLFPMSEDELALLNLSQESAEESGMAYQYLHRDGTWYRQTAKPNSDEFTGYYDNYESALQTVLKFGYEIEEGGNIGN